MTSPASPVPGKYARVERERRFLLACLPGDPRATAIRTITDRYLIGTTLRLRHMSDQRGGHQYKFTQKIPAASRGPVQGLITNTYLSEAEHDLLEAEFDTDNTMLPRETDHERRKAFHDRGVDRPVRAGGR